MAQHKAIYKSLYFQVIVAILIGGALGYFYPDTGAAMKPLGDQQGLRVQALPPLARRRNRQSEGNEQQNGGPREPRAQDVQRNGERQESESGTEARQDAPLHTGFDFAQTDSQPGSQACGGCDGARGQEARRNPLAHAPCTNRIGHSR